MSYDYAIIVKSKTRLELLIERFNTKSQAKFYIERSGGNFHEYEMEDGIFRKSLESLQSQLSKIVKNKIVEKRYLSSYIFSKNNLIVVIGQDGLVANTAKYSKNLPIVAVNPDIERYDGILLPFNTNDFIPAVEKVLLAKHTAKTIRFAEAKLNDGQRLLAFNDLFIGASSHVSARYKISFNKITERQSSSGIIVSTPAGSTGWLSSIFNMAYGVTNKFDKKRHLKQPKLKDNDLIFVVREPFKSISSQTGISTGIIRGNRLKIESYMPNNGIIFSDGVENDFMKFNSGSIVTIGLAQETAQLVLNE